MKKLLSLLMALCLLMGVGMAEETRIAVPVVNIDFACEGDSVALMSTDGVEGAYMFTYSVGGDVFYLIEYVGHYLCDGVWQSVAFELPENTLLTENENGIRQRKTYDFASASHTGDVTVVWYNECTIALLTSLPSEAYADGMQDKITKWLSTMTIDGTPIAELPSPTEAPEAESTADGE